MEDRDWPPPDYNRPLQLSPGPEYVLPQRYSRQLAPVDGGIYWHLYYRGARINGGLADNEHDARRESWSSAQHHSCRRVIA
jgi:hypothetical protein